jgi:hypothetical protein
MFTVVAPDWAFSESLRVMAVAGVPIHDVAILTWCIVLVVVYHFD